MNVVKQIKKMLVSLMVFVLLSSVVFAAQGSGGSGGGAAGQTGGVQQGVEVKAQVQNQERTEMKAGDATGLHNAMLRVRNGETAAHLEGVLAKIEAKRKVVLDKLESKTIESNDEGKVVMRGFTNTKFLNLVPMTRSVTFTINDDGSVTKTKTFFAGLFADEIE